MPHISRRPMQKKTKKQIEESFITALVSVGKQQEGKRFLHEVFTATEKVMLAKRLAIIFMLLEGYTFEHIQNLLKVTPATVVRIWKRYKNGEYIYIAKTIKKKKDREKFWQDLELILRAGLPPIVGKGRWRGPYR